ncbi:MAG: M28 family peptidase [Chloroflexi bacterium]|nr:M28 family peptidase [Chloroflexota bacterium]
MSDTALKHVEHLTNTIGPRGSATPEEKKAHEYCKQVLEGLGYEAHWEEFYSPVSGWHPFALALGLVTLADVLFVALRQTPNAQMGAAAAALIGLFAVVSFFLQITHRENPLRWFLPMAKSQNVWAAAKPRGEVKRRIVVVGHVDTHRTALAMQSPALWQVFQILTTASSVINIALVGLFIYGIVSPEPILRVIAMYLGLVLIVGLVFTLQPDFTPFVKGGNDNATGAAAVLALAERLKREPLTNTEVFLVNTGCEEVHHYGMADWIKRHAADARDADYLVLDNIGGKNSQLNYVTEESILLPYKSDPKLVQIAETVAKEDAELAAQPFVYRGLDSELSTCAHLGQRTLGLLNFDPKTKMPPHFHTAHDDFDNVDPALLDQSERFAWAIMQKIDS